ncbi:MAG TPA: hypothetical protein ENJ64_01440 [Thiotrichales bacterium]|nr:hypothetical protein [Thiotrichales bacterium]
MENSAALLNESKASGNRLKLATTPDPFFQRSLTLKETLIYSEFPRHTGVQPFSAANKLLKMKKKENCPPSYFQGLFVHG